MRRKWGFCIIRGCSFMSADARPLIMMFPIRRNIGLPSVESIIDINPRLVSVVPLFLLLRGLAVLPVSFHYANHARPRNGRPPVTSCLGTAGWLPYCGGLSKGLVSRFFISIHLLMECVFVMYFPLYPTDMTRQIAPIKTTDDPLSSGAIWSQQTGEILFCHVMRLVTFALHSELF